jgi:hypothetical protein
MPNAFKHRQLSKPAFQIVLVNKKKRRTKTATITLGSPVITILALLSWSQFALIQKILKFVWGHWQ